MVRIDDAMGYIDSDTVQIVSDEGDAFFNHPLVAFLV